MTRGIASRMRGRMRMSVRRVESAAGLVMEGRARGEREWRVAMPRWRAWMIICWMLCGASLSAAGAAAARRCVVAVETERE